MEFEELKYKVKKFAEPTLTITDSWFEQFHTRALWDLNSTNLGGFRILRECVDRTLILSLYANLLIRTDMHIGESEWIKGRAPGSDIKTELTYEHGRELFVVYSERHKIDIAVDITLTSNSHVVCDLESQLGFRKFINLVEGVR